MKSSMLALVFAELLVALKLLVSSQGRDREDIGVPGALVDVAPTNAGLACILARQPLQHWSFRLAFLGLLDQVDGATGTAVKPAVRRGEDHLRLEDRVHVVEEPSVLRTL